ncbi:hypothetical protein N5C62_23995 [Pseudomonas atacamensis]|uniref:hypothetical protein n=1 Tax=Pseudomonas atacamensis TaxID=2565368 RepID=UPI00244CD456|nr:hypothetical protein [Pseudomonas atacamensis]MDH1260739.1 hypothetical protein [Pseudomonas atacamensis]
MPSEYLQKLSLCKLDLEDLVSEHLVAQMCISASAPWHQETYAGPTLADRLNELEETAAISFDERHDTFEKLLDEVGATRSSFLSPAMHLNHYLDWMIEMGIDDFSGTWSSSEKPKTGPSLHLQSSMGSVYATSILISIKSALDKLVRVLQFYFSGISSHTTWGKYGKGGGFMNFAQLNSGSEPLLKYVTESYDRWIHLAVAPRNALIHYKDSQGSWEYLKDQLLFVRTHCVQDQDGNVFNYGVDTLCEFVREWYVLSKHVLSELSTRQPLVRKQPFSMQKSGD